MKSAHLIVVGKLKNKNLEALENDYLQRINNPNLTIHEVRAKAENKELEGKEVLKKIKDISKEGSSFVIALAEKGKEFDSPKFSQWIFDKLENYSKVIFVIAGAEGHSSEFLQQTHAKLSLSQLTFPHKIARLVFIEQFYRAITIKNNHPYHN